MLWPLGRRSDGPLTDVDRAYAQWAPFYPPEAHNRLMEVEEAAVTELLPTLAGRGVLDAGCGTGRYLARAARSGAETLIGVDRSAEMLRRVRVPAARLMRADIRALPLEGELVHAVICGLVLMDISDLRVALAEMRRVLVPGGVLVYSTLHPAGAAEGWTRTFETPEGRFEVPSVWHSVEAHLAACRDSGLVVDARREPVLDAQLPSGRRPVVLVVRARRVT